MGRAVAPLLAVLGIMFGCGLENNVTSLMPPNVPTPASPTTSTFTIDVPAATKENEFRGYELYYKLLQDPPGTIDLNLQNAAEYDLRTTYGYRPVCSASDVFSGSPAVGQNLHTHKPLIAVSPFDRSRAFLITVTFSTGTVPNPQPEVFYDGTPFSVSIRRNIPDTVSSSTTFDQPKPFSPLNTGDPNTYQASDIDVQGIWNVVKPGAAGSLYLVIYALSYGVYDITTDIYSPPIYLGYIQIPTAQ